MNMRLTLIPPAFIPYTDNSKFSTIFLCQQIGEALISLGHSVSMFAPDGSKSSLFNVMTFKGELQANILEKGRAKQGKTCLDSILDKAIDDLTSGLVDGVINFGHDPAPYLINENGFMNLVTFSRGMDHYVDSAIFRSLEAGQDFGFLSKSQAKSYSHSILEPLFCPISENNFPILPPTNTELLFAGRVTRSKGIFSAIDVAKKMGSILHIAGQCDDATKVAIMNTNTNKDIIDLKGNLQRNDLFKLMSESTAMLQLQTCNEAEAFGIVTAEALCAGLPVITWECGANTEIVNEDNGVIIPFGDLDAAQEAVSMVSRWDISKREEIKSTAREKYSIENIIKRYEKWIERNIR